MTTATLPADTVQIDDQEANELFLVAIDGADAATVEDGGSWRDERGFTWTRTTGVYDDGQTCDGWHVRDAAGEFVDFYSAA